MISAFRKKWNLYWFGNGDEAFDASLAFIRIFIHLSVLYFILDCTSADYTFYLTRIVTRNLYQPIGIYQLFGNNLFAPFVFNLIRVIALVFTITSILGLFTRPSMIISFVSNMFLVSVFYYFGKWSHGHNVVFLAQLAIIFSPAGRAYSFDALLLKRLKWWPINLLGGNNGNAKWAVRLAEIAVALMFFNAAFFKWANDPIHLGWVFSDNLRNLIIVRYNTDATEIPGYLKVVGNHEWLWKSLAMGNMISQTLPLVACFIHRYPKTRMLLGAFFVVEIFGLGLFANLWFLNWIPLYAVFIDWEYLLKNKNSITTGSSVKKFYPITTLYIGLFLLTYLSVGFYPRYGLQEILRPYPFTRFPMFANIVTPKPYSEHKSAEMTGNIFDVIDKGIIDNASGLYLKRNFYPFFPKNAIEQKEQLKTISKNLFLYKSLMPDTIKWENAILSIPAYPKPIGIVIKQKGLVGKIEANGNLQTASAEYKNEEGGYLYILSFGYKNPEIDVRYINNYNSAQMPLKGKWDSSHTKYYLSEKPKGNNLFVLCIKDGESKGVDIYFGGQAIF